MNCIFCKIVAGEILAYIVYENENFLVFLDREPINPGHLLIVPKKHSETIYDMSETDYADAFGLIRKIEGPLQRLTDAKIIGVAVSGLGVAHTHIHVVPLHSDSDLNPERAKIVPEEELQDMFEKIKPVLKEL
jgi:histidine triad (HIT) family protein